MKKKIVLVLCALLLGLAHAASAHETGLPHLHAQGVAETLTVGVLLLGFAALILRIARARKHW